MSGILDHQVSNIIQQLLIAEGYGTSPSSNTDWATFFNREPDSKDNQISVLDREGINGPRLASPAQTGLIERNTHHGFQILVKGLPREPAHVKAQAIASFLDQINNEIITIDSTTYTIFTIIRTSDVLNLGVEVEASRRSLFSINSIAALRSS